METMVSLSMVQVGVFAFLSCLCGAVYFSFRHQASLGWLAVTLFLGAIGIWLVHRARGEAVQWFALTLIAPAAYLALAQSIRAMQGQRDQYRWLMGAVIALTAFAALLVIADSRFLYQTLPFQLACALALVESVLRLARAPNKTALDFCLLATVCGLATVFFLRLPLYLYLFEPDAHYATVRSSAFQRISLTIAGILGPATAFLLLVKVIGGVITTYRLRSEQDELTGLLNRHGFDLAVATQGRAGGALILCDIDHFKRVNDRYGHSVGDDVLRAFARLLEPPGYPVGRMGGEEFAVLLPRGNVANAVGMAELIRQRFCGGSYPGVAPDHRLSASFGVAEFRSAADQKAAFIRADAALYRAKETGRNRVVVADAADGREGSRLRAA